MKETTLPKIGRLLYDEYLDENGEFKHASLVFVDEKPESEESMWPYVQIAMMEDYGDGLEVYTGMEAGMMKAEYTRVATDSDIQKFIDTFKNQKNKDEYYNLEKWKEDIASSEDSKTMLAEEKERVLGLIEKS